MKANKINGILWILIALFLLGVLIRGLNGNNWRNFRFWTWGWNTKTLENKIHAGNENLINDEDWNFESTDDYSIFTYNAKDISNIETNLVSEKLFVSPASSSDEIKVMIQNNVDVKKYYKVYKSGNTLVAERKSTSKINIHGIRETEVIIQVPDTLYNSASFNNVSGKIELENIKARKLSVNNVSGKTLINNCEGRIKTDNVSGKTEIIQSQLKNDIDSQSVSGKIEIHLTKDSNFTADFETVSGSVKSDFSKVGKKSGTISNGSRDYDIQLETVSGSIEINSL